MTSPVAHPLDSCPLFSDCRQPFAHWPALASAPLPVPPAPRSLISSLHASLIPNRQASTRPHRCRSPRVKASTQALSVDMRSVGWTTVEDSTSSSRLLSLLPPSMPFPPYSPYSPLPPSRDRVLLITHGRVVCSRSRAAKSASCPGAQLLHSPPPRPLAPASIVIAPATRAKCRRLSHPPRMRVLRLRRSPHTSRLCGSCE
ncbi:hypothetical protein B0H16DRAFT_231979 [Mycena metata]|uniref:Uncharacterized protein n=1 Tax=Mycena metata TaxID=1033252 RepID=A0AAD7MRP6_9AGAR|nr:hypothetical protein B0H16DRAFT_231979 [Mycena metata]